jgi:hypothetical protein
MSLADKRWAQEAVELPFTQLTTIRTVAGNWRTGLIALTALLTTVTIIKGPDTAGDLSFWGRVVVAIFLGSGLVLLLAGSAIAMLAAYGIPTELQSASGELLRAWTKEETQKAKDYLRVAAECFFFAIALIAVAIAFTWFDSDIFPPEPPAQLVVDLKPVNSQPVPAVCGELKSGDGSKLVLKVKTATGTREQTIQADQIKGMAIKAECPT